MAKPRGEPRDRAFGGKAGIWLKKRKQSVANDVPSKQHKVTPQSVDAGSLVASNGKVGVPQLTTTSYPAKRIVVGWDDVRCRPIYKKTSSGASTSSTSVDETDDDESVEGVKEARDDVSNREDCTMEDYRAVQSSLLVCSSSSNDAESRKTREYGSRKRRANLMHTSHDISKLKRQHVPKKKESFPVASFMTPSINRMSFDLATPQTGLGNICAALNSEIKATPLDPLVSDDHKKVSKQPKKGLLIKRKKATQQAMPSLAQLDFVDENVRQPSSTTSLAAAKAFFERLDAQQKLTLDASGTPVMQGKRCVRTRRAIHIESDSLREEYQEYAAATKATGIEPLSVEQYAVNRSAFFRTGDMYDGFLDE